MLHVAVEFANFPLHLSVAAQVVVHGCHGLMLTRGLSRCELFFLAIITLFLFVESNCSDVVGFFCAEFTMIFYKMTRFLVFLGQGVWNYRFFLYLCTEFKRKRDILIGIKSLMTI